VSDFPGTAGRVPTGSPKPDIAPTCGTKIRPKPSAAGSVERGDAAEWTRPAACGKRGNTPNGQNQTILDAAARKQDKRMASKPTLFLFTTARSADCIKGLRRRCDWRLFGEK